MASKITYWKCADCNSMINDENMHDFTYPGDDAIRLPRSVPVAEFCYGCMSYNPEVVLAYA